MFRFALATLLARIVLAEQGVALDLARDLGVTGDQIGQLSVTMFLAAACGAVIGAVLADGEKHARPMMLATGIIAIAALSDSRIETPADLLRLFVSQAAIAFAGVLFLGPALLLGITAALQRGGRELISFIVLFGVVNSLGGLAGPALLDAYVDLAAQWHGAILPARRDALGAAAALAGATSVYLAVLLALRIRRRLAALRAGLLAGPVATAMPDAPAPPWHPQRMSPITGCLLLGVAGLGVTLLVMAWGMMPAHDLPI